MATYQNITITHEYLDLHPNSYYIYGSDLTGKAVCKKELYVSNHLHALGFIVKKYNDSTDASYYRLEEYSVILFEEIKKLSTIIRKRPDKMFFVSKLGADHANKFRIWELLICHNLVRELEEFDNVTFCWEDRFV